MRFISFSRKRAATKGINVDSLGRYTRALQSQIYKAFKKTKVAPSTGYVVIAIARWGRIRGWI
jgi:hypothetical protein